MQGQLVDGAHEGLDLDQDSKCSSDAVRFTAELGRIFIEIAVQSTPGLGLALTGNVD